MTEKDWGDLDALPPQKSGAPKWLWFCGCGCLVMFLMAVVATWGTVSWFKTGIEGEDRWERLAEVLPYDERPADYDLVFGQKVPFVDIEIFLFKANSSTGSRTDGAEGKPSAEKPGEGDADAEGSDSADGDSSKERRVPSPFMLITSMSPEMSKEGMPEMSSSDDAEVFTIQVQGRDLKAVRLQGNASGGFRGLPMEQQPTLMVDLTAEGGSGGLLLLAGREHSRVPVDPDEIVKFLETFHVGPEH